MLLPLHPGGGPTEEAKTNRFLRSAEGVGSSARDDSGIDGLWRWARARGLAAATSAYRRAIANAYPQAATDLLPYYERALGLPVAIGTPEADRVATVVPAWSALPAVTFPALEAALQEIDNRFSLVERDEDKSGIAWDGRWFGPLADVTVEPAFDGTGCSAWAAHTSRYHLLVLFDVGHATGYTVPDGRNAAAAEQLLLRSLPSWWDFTIVTSIGFLAGISPVGMTGVEDD